MQMQHLPSRCSYDDIFNNSLHAVKMLSEHNIPK